MLNLEAGTGYTKVIRAKVADFGLSRFMQTMSNNKRSKADLLSNRSSKNDQETKTKPEEMSRIMTAGQGTGKRFNFFSHSFTHTLTHNNNNNNTAVYMAPEITSNAMHTLSSYTIKVDVYAFAMIMWSTLEFAVPWSTDIDEDDDSAGFTYPIFEKVERGERPHVSRGATAPPGYVSLMRKCWSQKAKDRPTFNMITHTLRNMRYALHNSKQRKSKITSKVSSGLKRHSMPIRSKVSSDLMMSRNVFRTTRKKMSNGSGQGVSFQFSHSAISVSRKRSSSLNSADRMIVMTPVISEHNSISSSSSLSPSSVDIDTKDFTDSS